MKKTRKEKIRKKNTKMTKSTLVIFDITLFPVTNFIQLVSPQLVDQFSQTKLYWKAMNKNYLYIYGIYKSNNKQLRYQTISNFKSFVWYYLMNGWMDLHNQTCIGKCLSICF